MLAAPLKDSGPVGKGGVLVAVGLVELVADEGAMVGLVELMPAAETDGRVKLVAADGDAVAEAGLAVEDTGTRELFTMVVQLVMVKSCVE